MRIWTNKELEAMEKYYPYNTNELLASEFNRSVSSIRNKANKMSLIKKIDNIGCFKKGVPAWNKGMPHPSRGLSSKTHFKKGGLPHNTKHNGAISIRNDKRDGKNKFIRISKAKWIPLQKYNWEKINGEIPKGMILRCKNGDTLNVDPGNWEVISRADNIRLNQNREKAGESMKKAWRKKHLRKIYELD